MSTEWTNQTAGAVDEKLGLVSLRVPFFVSPLSTKIETLLEAITFRPADLDNFPLPLIRRDVNEQNDGSYQVVFTFDGKIDPDDNEESEEFSLEGTTSEDPIETHQDIEKLIEEFGGERNDDGKVIFDLTIEREEEEVKNPMHGVSSYLVPGLVWTHTFTARSFPDSMVRALGTIDEPAIGRNGQRAPELSGKRNWLLIRVRATWRGNLWKIERSWMLSGPGGWNPKVYRQT